MSESESTNTADTVTPRLYTEAQAAKYLGRTLWGMRELRYAGKIPFIPGRHKTYDIKDLDEWIERNKTRNTF